MVGALVLPFWSPGERRLRAFWRLLLYVLVWRALLVLLDRLLIPAGMGLAARPGLAAPALERALHFAYYLASVLGVTWLMVWGIDRRPLRDLGLALSARWWRELGVGLLLGVLLIAAIFAVQWLLGWVQVTATFAVRVAGPPFVVALLGPLAIFVIIGFCEELIFRGYLLRNCAEGLRGPLGAPGAVIAAWLISALLFGLYHVFNPFASWVSTLNPAVGGLLLGLPVILTGRLALAVGLHTTWNFAQGNLFGYAVSGNDFSGTTLLRTQVTGPDLWTGGAFGPEAGLLGLFAMGIGVLLLLWWLRRADGRLTLHTPLAHYGGRAPAKPRESVEYRVSSVE